MARALSFSLRSILVIKSILLVFTCTGLVLIAASYIASRQVKEDVGRYLAEQANSYADMLDRDMWSRAKEIEVLSRLDAFRRLEDLPQLDAIIQQLHASIPAYAWIGLLNAQGDVLASSGNILKGKNIAQRPVFAEALKGVFVGDVHDAVLLSKLLPNPTGEAMKFVDISMPIYGEENRLVGVLATHLSWAWVNELDVAFLQQARAEQVELFVVARDGVVLLGDAAHLGQKLELPILQQAGPASMVQRWPDGKDYVTGAALGDGHLNYSGLGWTVLTRQPLEIAYKSVTRMEHVIIMIGSVCILIMAGAGAMTAQWITRPLRGLVAVAGGLRRGAAVVFPPYAGIKEIETLYVALQAMDTTLTATQAERDGMRILAFEDKLTHLPNRRAFEDRVAGLKTRAMRRNQLLAILFLDLDGFKHVNDALGHDAGDLVLQAVAIRLKGSLRSDDAVFRLGGDEFVILAHVEAKTAGEEAQALADRIIRAVNTPMRIKDTPVHVGCSLGGALYPEHSPEPDTVVQQADAALYQAKAGGKNRLVLHAAPQATPSPTHNRLAPTPRPTPCQRPPTPRMPPGPSI